MFSGSFTALLTPFKNGGIDEDGFQAFVDWQISEGTHGLVPVGQTALAAGAVIDFTVHATWAVNMFVLTPDCDNIQILYSETTQPLAPGVISFPTEPGSVFWLWVGPTGPGPFVRG